MSTSACHRTRPELTAYVDDELGADARRLVVEHLASCLSCRREVEQLRTLRRWLADLPQIAPGATFAADFARRLAAEPKPGAARRGRGARVRRWVAPALAAAAVLALALRSFTVAPSPPAATPGAAPGRVAAAPAATAARIAAAASPSPAPALLAHVDRLRPEDLPPELLEHPELFLRLPVVRRLEALEHLGALHDHDDGRAG